MIWNENPLTPEIEVSFEMFFVKLCFFLTTGRMVFICSHHHLELPTGILSCSFHHAESIYSISPNTCHSIVLPVYLLLYLGHLRHFFHLQFFQSRSAAVGRWEKDLPNKTGCHPWNSPWNLKATWTKAHLKASHVCKKWIKPQITQTYMIWNENH